MIALGAAASPASAQEYRVTPPAGWLEMPDLAASQDQTMVAGDPFGGLRFEVKVTAHAQPGEGGFYTTWVAALEPAKNLGASVRAALDDGRSARMAASPQAGSTEELSYRESIAGGIAEAQLSWRHLSNETVSHSRALVWASEDGRPRMARAECVLGVSSGTDAQTACKAALASLTPAPVGKLGNLGTVPAATRPDERRDPERFRLGGESAEGQSEPSVASEQAASASEGPVLKPPSGGGVVYRELPDASDGSGGINKALVLIGGLLLVAAIWYTSRRRHDKGDAGARDRDSKEQS